jgi:hypothetical protein
VHKKKTLIADSGNFDNKIISSKWQNMHNFLKMVQNKIKMVQINTDMVHTLPKMVHNTQKIDKTTVCFSKKVM